MQLAALLQLFVLSVHQKSKATTPKPQKRRPTTNGLNPNPNNPPRLPRFFYHPAVSIVCFSPPILCSGVLRIPFQHSFIFLGRAFVFPKLKNQFFNFLREICFIIFCPPCQPKKKKNPQTTKTTKTPATCSAGVLFSRNKSVTAFRERLVQISELQVGSALGYCLSPPIFTGYASRINVVMALVDFCSPSTVIIQQSMGLIAPCRRRLIMDKINFGASCAYYSISS